MPALTFTDEQTARLLAALALDEGADAETVVLAVEEMAKREAERDTAAAKPSEIAAAAKRVGMELVDADTVAALRHDASEGRKLAAAARQQKIEADIDEAIRLGKIAPSRRQHWVKLAAADEGMLTVLREIPPETAVAFSEIGHSTEPGDRDGIAELGKWFFE